MLLRSVRNKHFIAAIPLVDGFFGNKYDIVEGQNIDAFYQAKEAENITGWQRLRNLFRKHEDDVIHPKVIELIQTSAAGFVMGGMYGAISRSRTAFIHFIENNEATQFRNHLDAKRKLSDAMFRSYLKGFGQWSTKVGVFVSVFTCVQLALSVYHNKYSFWHYSAGGATAGAIYKFSLGPKGMVAGAFFGGIFGSIYGSFKIILLKLTNQTEEDLLAYRQSLKNMKDNYEWKVNKKNQADQVEEELKQAMMNPKSPVVTS